MGTASRLFFGLALLLALTSSAFSQAPPREVSICDLRKDPKAFDQMLVKVRGFATLAFENFSFHDVRCDQFPGIWLMYGGDAETPTPSTWNDTKRAKGRDIKFHGKTYSINKDQGFSTFKAALADPGKLATATLTGTFFAAKTFTDASGRKYPSGYGHLGCCHLFIISQISDVEVAVKPKEVRGIVTSPDGRAVGGVDVFVGSLEAVPSTKTDEFGGFTIPATDILHFRTPAYRPKTVLREPLRDSLAIVLEPSNASDWIVPNCSARKEDRVGLHARFFLPGSSLTSRDTKRDQVVTYVRFEGGRWDERDALRITVHNESSSAGVPGLLISLSDSSEERWIKNAVGDVIGLESRGEGDGRQWRLLSFEGRDSAMYLWAPTKRAKFFDSILDSVCWSSKAP